MFDDILKPKVRVTVDRKYFLDKYTIGHFLIDGRKMSDTLEDKVRDLDKDGFLTSPGEIKVYGETAIPFTPTGKCYYGFLENNAKRGLIIRLTGVNHFSGILVHSGNTPEHTKGCILPGWNKVKGKVINSKKAMKLITDELLKFVKIGEVFPVYVVTSKTLK